MAEVYPELVTDPKGQPSTVRYQLLEPMLLNELQKQYHRSEKQAETIAAQQDQIQTQAQKIADLEGRLSRWNQ